MAEHEEQTNGADSQAQVGILAQYVKDLSFENPNAPRSLQLAGQPKIDVNVNVNAKRAGEDVYEVELRVGINAQHEDMVIFAVELVYGGLFGLRNVPEDALEPFLVIEAPRLLFPFVRRIVADSTRDGGFAPLMLDPIDFTAMYMAQRNRVSANVDVEGHA
jgi:preprotein translocase subunit SecB